MAKKFWKTQRFKNLKNEWEKRLKISGFVDIEDERGRLKQNAGNSYRTTIQVSIENKRRYYELLAQSYHKEKRFRDTVEKMVMLLRSRGMKIVDIEKGLRSINKRSHHDTLRKIIRKYEARWKIKRR